MKSIVVWVMSDRQQQGAYWWAGRWSGSSKVTQRLSASHSMAASALSGFTFLTGRRLHLILPPWEQPAFLRVHWESLEVLVTVFHLLSLVCKGLRQNTENQPGFPSPLLPGATKSLFRITPSRPSEWGLTAAPCPYTPVHPVTPQIHIPILIHTYLYSSTHFTCLLLTSLHIYTLFRAH